MRFLIIILGSLLCELTYGAGGADVNEIPWDVIKAQAVNVALTIGLLVYFLRGKIKELFFGRVEKFDEEYKKAQAIKEEAKAKRNEIKERLHALKLNAEKSIQDSHVQAQANTEKLLADTQVASKRIISDAEGKVQNQLGKVVGNLKLDLLKKSFEKARGDISDEISQPELQRLKEEFMKNIQVAKQ